MSLQQQEMNDIPDDVDVSCSQESSINIIQHSSEDVHEKVVQLQAQVFIEDAENYRSVHHKVDSLSLRLYRLYYSCGMVWLMRGTQAVLLLLSFIEWPSSLSLTADLRVQRSHPRIRLPCGVTESIELTCLLILLADAVFKTYVFGTRNFIKNPWQIGYCVLLIISFLDWTVSISLGCNEFYRVRRFLRPYFLVQNSPLLKKIIKCLRNTIPGVLSTLILLLIWLVIGTIFGMCLLSRIVRPMNMTLPIDVDSNATAEPPVQLPTSDGDYFRDFFNSLFSLLVLLTTANHPDIMMEVYNKNRFYAIFFIVFLFIGLYVFMNILTAGVYNHFRGYFLSAIQTSLFRRRVALRAAFEVLQSQQAAAADNLHPREHDALLSNRAGVSVVTLVNIIKKCRLVAWKKKIILEHLGRRIGCVLRLDHFNDVFAALDETNAGKTRPPPPHKSSPFGSFLQRIVLSKTFHHIGTLVCFVNIIALTVEVSRKIDTVFSEQNVELDYMNIGFILFYCFEQITKCWALSPRGYFSSKGNILDCVITLVLVITEICELIFFRTSYFRSKWEIFALGISFWDVARVVNMLLILRALRLLMLVEELRLVTSTLVDLFRNMPPVAGLFLLIYHTFALLGMALFNGAITYADLKINTTGNGSKQYECGTYQQLNYWSNNFDDFAASLVLLWDLMVVNNWHVIVQAYVSQLGKWVILYMASWWLIAVVIVLSVFTAIIIENYVYRWDRYKEVLEMPTSRRRSILMEQSLSFHQMFHGSLIEPEDAAILQELSRHQFLSRDLPHLHLSRIDT